MPFPIRQSFCTYLGDSSDPLSLNLYTYCANNPLVYVDPSGHWPEWLEKLYKKASNEVQYVAKVVANEAQYVGEVISNKAKDVASVISKFDTIVIAPGDPKRELIESAKKSIIRQRFDSLVSAYFEWQEELEREQYDRAVKFAQRNLEWLGKTPENTPEYYELVDQEARMYVNSMDTAMGVSGGLKFVRGSKLRNLLSGRKVNSIIKGTSNAIKYGPMNKGPLADEIANTFRSGTYTKIVTQEETTLYRVYGGKAGELGSYWTRTKPQGPMQSTIDSALDQNWGNTATNVSTIKVPKGITIFEGAAAEQRALVGGGNQVYIEKVDASWLVK